MSSDDNCIDFDQLFGNDEDEAGYFEWNRKDPNVLYIDTNENAIDSLETALLLSERNDNLKWKWIAFALHHSLYSFCISALENGNYENVLYKGKEDEWIVSFSNEKIEKKSRIVPFHIKKYKTPAFRIEWESINKLPEKKKRIDKKILTDNLIGFWTALARVQDQYFWMGRLHSQKAVQISDDELEQIVWLSEAVRNDLTHFVPKGYSIGIKRIITASKVMLAKIDFLVFESFSILFVDYERSRRRIRDAIDKLTLKLAMHQEIFKKSSP